MSKFIKIFLYFFILSQRAKVFYDKPHECFRPVDNFERETLFKKLQEKNIIQQIDWNNCAYLVSSSSWTEDEDFQILIDALKSLFLFYFIFLN